MGPKKASSGAARPSSKSPAPAKKAGASTKSQEKKASSRSSKSPGPKTGGAMAKGKGNDAKNESGQSSRGRSKSPRTPRKDEGKDKKKKGDKGAADQKDGAEEKKEVKEEGASGAKAEDKSEEKAADATAAVAAEDSVATSSAAEAKSSPEAAKPRRNRKKVEMPAAGLSGKIFMQAVADNDLDAVEFYLESGPLAEDIINYQNNSQMTPLMFACQHKKDLICLELLKLLLNAKTGDGGVGKVGVDMQNRDGYTALHFAARKGHAECVKILVDFDADFTIVSTGSE